MEMAKVRDTKQGEIVRIGRAVYVREEYDREDKTYRLRPMDDCSSAYRHVKGSKDVEIRFTF
jgi:hypothetical protein